VCAGVVLCMCEVLFSAVSSWGVCVCVCVCVCMWGLLVSSVLYCNESVAGVCVFPAGVFNYFVAGGCVGVCICVCVCVGMWCVTVSAVLYCYESVAGVCVFAAGVFN